MNLEEHTEPTQADKKTRLNNAKDTNSLGVEGYPTSRDPELAEWFPLPSKVYEFHDNYCEDNSLSEIPVNVELSPADQEDMSPLIKVGAAMVASELGAKVEDLSNLSVVSPSGSIRDANRPTYMMVETYSDKDKTVYIANRATFEDQSVAGDLREDLAKSYNLPEHASMDYIMLYLSNHSVVHHIQNMQGRVVKKPDGDDPKKAYLELETEKEAHQVAIKVTDDIWDKTVSRQFIGMS